MTELQLARDVEKADCTFGTFQNAGAVECQTLEPPKAHPFPERRRIPAGRYLARLRYSPAHGYAVYGYVNVPGFSDVEIHPGNDVLDTKACTLTGNSRGTIDIGGTTYDAVLASRDAFKAFMTARGCPLYKSLTSWDAVRDFVLHHPEAECFWVTVTDPGDP
jgi:hypothetical protein